MYVWWIRQLFHSKNKLFHAGLGSRVFLAPWSRSRLKKNQEPEPLGKKSGAGAGAAKKLAGSSALREDKKHKEIVLLLLFFR